MFFPESNIKVGVICDMQYFIDTGFNFELHYYTANVHFQYDGNVFSVFNVKVSPSEEFGYFVSKDNKNVLIISLKNEKIIEIEKIEDIGKDFNNDHLFFLN